MAVNSQPNQDYTQGIDTAFKKRANIIYRTFQENPNFPQKAILSLPKNHTTENGKYLCPFKTTSIASRPLAKIK